MLILGKIKFLSYQITKVNKIGDSTFVKIHRVQAA